MTKKISEQEFDSKKHIKEYKRKCNQCNKLWHSLVSREKEIEDGKKIAAWNQVSNSCACKSGSALQAQRNVGAYQDSLDKLHKCPECGSQNYTEEIIIYEKK